MNHHRSFYDEIQVNERPIESMSLQKGSSILSGLLIVLVCLLFGGRAAGQTSPDGQSPGAPVYQGTPLPTQTPSTGALSAPMAAPSQPGSNNERPIYGLQGVLVETLDGKPIASQAADESFNPASATKIATALIALRTFGPQHRFATGVWTSGNFDKATGTINGDLYISGRDPSFHYEHAVMIARQLNILGIRTVTGNLIVAPGFSMNFSSSARRSGAQLYDTLDATLRSEEATRAWIYERTALADKTSLQTVPSVAVMGDVEVSSVAGNATLLLSHKSSKLVDILKVLLCYSNNFMAERIGDTLGGLRSVSRQVRSSLGLSPDELRLASLSGLGVNRASPRTMMKIYRALREELRKNKLSTTDILPVAGIDPGTLEDRFNSPPWRGSIIAKTGTLMRTDGGASALVGQMRNANGETLLFVIMNRRGNVARFRENQDAFLMEIQNTRGGPKAFDYQPHTLAMKLADTQNAFSSASEYEPVVKTPPGTP
jgi:serine-type D-Ala-D-Ala carboxypeptidase/endopeptidase (penicillin-binding protein 4)